MSQIVLDLINYHGFVEKLRNNLEKLSRKQKAEFAWLCVVRAMPFIGIGKNFDYFSGLDSLANYDDKQERLFSLFWCLDLMTANIYGIPTKYTIYHSDICNKALITASNVRHMVQDKSYTKTVFAAAYAYQTASDASMAPGAAMNDYSAVLKKGDEDPLDRYIKDAACNLDSAYLTINKKSKEGILELLYLDIEKIYSNKLNELDNALDIYGGIWQNFLNSLKSIGCSYWVNLYNDFFENKFHFDMKELEKRVNIPEEIREKGALFIGKWLEK